MTTLSTPDGSPRKMSRYTCCQYRQLAIPEGGSVTARIEVMIEVPHDAVLETRVTRLGLTLTRNAPVGDYNQISRGEMRIRNIHPEVVT